MKGREIAAEIHNNNKHNHRTFSQNIFHRPPPNTLTLTREQQQQSHHHATARSSTHSHHATPTSSPSDEKFWNSLHWKLWIHLHSRQRTVTLLSSSRWCRMNTMDGILDLLRILIFIFIIFRSLSLLPTFSRSILRLIFAVCLTWMKATEQWEGGWEAKSKKRRKIDNVMRIRERRTWSFQELPFNAFTLTAAFLSERELHSWACVRVVGSSDGRDESSLRGWMEKQFFSSHRNFDFFLRFFFFIDFGFLSSSSNIAHSMLLCGRLWG